MSLDKGLFPRAEMPKEAEPEAAAKPSKKADKPKAAKAEATSTEVIAFDDFLKVELRVATVLACEKVEGSDKLLRFQLDLGSEKRQVVSGVAKHVDPGTVPGTQVVLVANLAPRKIFKVESQGMILTTETADGGIALLRPSSPAPAGSQVT